MRDRPSLEELAESVRQEAERLEFPVDLPVYERHGRDPRQPIVCAGALDAPVCVVGRDLGKDEVRAGEPLIGQAGRLVRLGIVAAWGDQTVALSVGDRLAHALDFALLTNIVPYKPPGNKAYPESVRRRFRPFLETLLVRYWRGTEIITLGSEAFAWFHPYLETDAAKSNLATAERFSQSYRCRLGGPAAVPGAFHKAVTVHPLPHPSPLNRRYYSAFPLMLANRLAEIRRHIDERTH